MAITYVGGDADFSSVSGDVTLDVDASAQVGDVVVVFGAYPAGGSPGAVGPSNSTGWTELTSGSRPLFAGSTHTVWVLEFTSTPPSTITFTNVGGGSVRNMCVQMGIWRSVDQSSRDFPAPATDNSGTVTSINHPSTTVPSPGGLVVIAGHFDNSDITSRVPPTGFTERLYQNPAEGSNLTNSQYMASREDAPPGSTGALTYQFAGNNADKVLFTVSFAEAGGGGATSILKQMMHYYQ